MGWTLSLFSIVIFGSSLVATSVGLAALRKRPDPVAWPLALLMFAVTAWAVPHAISLGFATLERVTFWNQLRYPGTVFAPVLYLVVALKYAGYDRELSRRVYAGLALIPILTVLTVWTNQFHGLFWESLSIATVGGASVLVPKFGLWYWANIGYLYLITVSGLGIFAREVLRSSRVYRKQAGMMFIGGVVPLAVNVAIVSGVGPDPSIDFTTIALTLSGLTFGLALFRLELLEIRPIARDRLLDELEDGVVVVGPNGRIRDFNPTAERILGDLSLNQHAEGVLPSDVVANGGELVVEIDARERVYRTQATTLTDERGQYIGRIVHMNDVTEIVKREQRISVLNRILRHNVRNELNVASGRLELVAGHLSTDQEDHVETAVKAINRVIGFAEKARYVEQTLKESDTGEDVSVTTIADRVVTQTQDAYSDAVIEYLPSTNSETESLVRVVDDELFEMALRELVENGIVHNDHESPHVTVHIESVGDRTRVSVADNGPGIPDGETDILTKRTETGLNHGGGVGLWLVKWMASLSSGELSFTENNPRGSVVTLTLRNAEND